MECTAPPLSCNAFRIGSSARDCLNDPSSSLGRYQCAVANPTVQAQVVIIMYARCQAILDITSVLVRCLIVYRPPTNIGQYASCERLALERLEKHGVLT